MEIVRVSHCMLRLAMNVFGGGFGAFELSTLWSFGR
jgi:hypothetical protein